MTTHVEGREYDIIFAGGGTAACVAAGRLARVNPDLSILLVEGGKNNFNDPTVTNPALYLSHLVPGSQTALFYEANSEEALNGRKAIVPCGGMLGGGSSINFMMYTRAQGVDFDDWETEGWDAKSILPYMKRLENYHLKDESINQDLHGHDGPVNISMGTYFQDGPAEDFLAGSTAVGQGVTADAQDLKACNVFSKWAKYISPDGKRQDAAHTYIHPLMQAGTHPNLHLLVNSKVTRVIFDENKRATGIEYVPTPSSQPETSLSKPVASTVTAKRLVVVSAGALGTPSILERSGVGKKEVLEKANVPVVCDLPDVGEHYQDHHLLLYPYKTSLKPGETLDALLSGRKDFGETIAANEPVLGWNAIDVAAKIRPTDAEVAELGPEFQKRWDEDFKDRPTRPLMLTGVVCSFLGDPKVLPQSEDGNTQQYATLGMYTAYPYSRGNIHITSPDVSVPASFNTGFFSDPADVKKQIWAYKKSREIYRRTDQYRGELDLGHPKFPEGSKAALHDGPAATFSSPEDRKNLPPLEYSAEDDKAIEQFLRDNVNTTWHSMGTCRMAPREKGGVVDGGLNVYGVTGLKLCDLSICPGNVGANTNNTAFVVGEKAADIIAQDLGMGPIGDVVKRVDSAQ
ncbi:alcohol oxidase [Acrodontium crateriforme]|uniref:Alcohol oxidase n=1 Tax=Acrodontium crateriforme TaxID=150365 RepID=A0AAQ3LY76_9PEZI|nr:alcohol oxidase [Acrodontium crateriforme]